MLVSTSAPDLRSMTAFVLPMRSVMAIVARFAGSSPPSSGSVADSKGAGRVGSDVVAVRCAVGTWLGAALLTRAGAWSGTSVLYEWKRSRVSSCRSACASALRRITTVLLQNGGPRAGARGGGSVGSPRWRRILRMLAGSCTSAYSRSVPPQRQRVASWPKLRRSSSARERRRQREGVLREGASVSGAARSFACGDWTGGGSRGVGAGTMRERHLACDDRTPL